MNLKELEYFAAICEEKSITRAAERLFIGQPTLTKFVQRINEEYGVPLLVRQGGRMQPTYAGERFLSYARQILQTNRSLENEMNAIRRLDVGQLRIGMPPVRCSLLLPVILPAFHEHYPNVRITITEDTSANLDRMLAEGMLDLAFFSLSTPRNQQLCETILEDAMFAVLKKGHPIGNHALTEGDDPPGIRLEWLKDETLLVQKPQQRQGEFIRRELEHIGLIPADLQYYTNIRAAISLAASGYGVAFAAGSLLDGLRDLCEFDSYRLLDTMYPLRFVAAMKPGIYRAAYLDDFIRLVKEHYNIAS